MCINRETAGRDRFGYGYLEKDNEAEGLEEATDGANYAMFSVLKARRAGDYEDEDVALTAVYHAFKMYEALDHLRQRRQGAP
jgi:hypothetical protein